MAQKQAYITIKDHKDNFINNTKCRLINGAKSEVGKISKQIIQRINNEVRTAENLQQWRNTAAVIERFKNLNEKTRIVFLQLDIQEFYPSISEQLVDEALQYASGICSIYSDEIDIIKNSCKSLLFSEGVTWQKKPVSSTSPWARITAPKYANWLAYSSSKK